MTTALDLFSETACSEKTVRTTCTIEELDEERVKLINLLIDTFHKKTSCVINGVRFFYKKNLTSGDNRASVYIYTEATPKEVNGALFVTLRRDEPRWKEIAKKHGTDALEARIASWASDDKYPFRGFYKEVGWITSSTKGHKTLDFIRIYFV